MREPYRVLGLDMEKTKSEARKHREECFSGFTHFLALLYQRGKISREERDRLFQLACEVLDELNRKEEGK